MICEGCTPITLYCCSDKIILGAPPNPFGDYLLKITDITNGRILVLPVGNDGITMVVGVEDFQFASNHSYEFTLHTTDDLSTPISWTLEDKTTEVDCLAVRFQKPMTQDDEVYYIINQVVAV